MKGQPKAKMRPCQIIQDEQIALGPKMDIMGSLNKRECRDDLTPKRHQNIDRQSSAMTADQRRITAASRAGRKADPLSAVFLTSIRASITSLRSINRPWMEASIRSISARISARVGLGGRDISEHRLEKGDLL